MSTRETGSLAESTAGTLTVEAVYEALDTVRDPCMTAGGLDLSILYLGLVYDVEAKDGRVRIDMTLTELGCIFTHRIIGAVYDAVEALPEAGKVEVVPVWTPERLNEKASQALARSKGAMFQTIKGRGLQVYSRSG